MILNIAKIAKNARIKLPDLITRPIGKKMYEKMGEQLANVGDDEIVILDFDSIEVIDSSFIDEFLVKLMVEPQYSGIFLKLRNISPIIEVNIESVFLAYSKYNRRIAIMKEDFGSKKKYYLGKLLSIEEDILDYMRINKSTAVGELADFLRISKDKTEETLNELVDLKLIRMYNNRYTSV